MKNMTLKAVWNKKKKVNPETFIGLNLIIIFGTVGYVVVHHTNKKIYINSLKFMFYT